VAIQPLPILLDPLLRSWLAEDLGRSDRTSQSLVSEPIPQVQAVWVAKESGVVAGVGIGARVFQLLDPHLQFTPVLEEGQPCQPGQVIAKFQGELMALLVGERVALNLAMRLSGIATATRQYASQIEDLPTQLVDTRKTTPGLRLLEKYATQVGGAINHRLGLDDAVMIKDNHIAAAGSISEAIRRVRAQMSYPLTIEVETESLTQVEEALDQGADIIMLDNMAPALMVEAVAKIRSANPHIKIEASGNITLATIRTMAETGVDYISTSAPITRSTWLDLSMGLNS
jgi:nicotinate-nucleotide pyrophosphorylase (carboxylating)